MGTLGLMSDHPDLAVHRQMPAAPPGPGTLTRAAFDAAASIAATATLAELDAAMVRGVGPLGFTVMMLGEIRNDQMRFIAGNPDKAYVAHFMNCPTMTEDVVYRAILERRPGFFWSDITSRPGLTPAQQRMIEERAAFGFREGLILALPQSNGRTTFVGMAGAQIDAADPEVRAAAQVLASCYGIAALRLTGAETPALVALTRRQIDCLSWAREGKSTADIASILGISAHTAQEHISSACTRLGVRTRVQAVAAAQAMTLIPEALLPAPLRMRRLPTTT